MESIADWLRHETVDRAITRLPVQERAELGRLLPEHAGTADGRPDGDPAEARARLFRAAAAALAGAGTPLLLVLDDMQWCDADTVDFVLHLLRRGPLDGALVAMTRRTHERPTDPSLDVKLADLRAEALLVDRLLGRLQPVSTAMIARLASDQTWSDREVAKLHVETDGLPLFVVEAARSGPGAQHLTPTVKGTIERRLRRLEPAHRSLLDVAATIGRRFEPTELAHAAGRSEDGVVDALDELWQLGLVVPVGLEFDFGHDQFREVVASAISPARRRRLHRNVARALVAVRGSEVAVVADRLAEHYEQAGLVDDAIDASRAAASRASTIGAHRQAIQHLQRAMALLTGRPADMDRDRRELVLVTELGTAQAVQDGYGDAQTQRTWARAESLNVRLGTTLSDAVLRGLGLAAVAGSRFERAATYGDALCVSDDAVARVEGHYVLGVTRHWQGDFDRAEHHLRRAIDDYDPANSAAHRARFGQHPKPVCLSRLGHLTALRGRAIEADRYMDEAAGLAAQLDDSLTAWYVWHWRVNLDRYLDRETTSRPPDGPAHGFFSATDREQPLWVEALSGNLDAELELEGIVRSWRAEGRCVELIKWLGVLAQIRIAAGDETRALVYLDEADAFAHSRGQRYLTPELGRLRAKAMRQRNDAGCSEVAEGAVHAAETMGASGMMLRALAELLRCTGDRSVAGRLRTMLERLRPVHHGWDVDDAESALEDAATA